MARSRTARRAHLLAALLAVCALLLGAPREALAVNDPTVKWYTIETPHFRISYHSGVEKAAQHAANVAEGIFDTMRGSIGWTPGEPTEIFLTDFTESANGSATALPYNAIRLFVTSPEDMSPLGDVDDWFLELITHEYTHILHTDHIRGIPAIVNKVLGKTLAPNQVQPRWILEGLGVYSESARTSGGRLRNSQWDMYMRADVLGDNVATLDQLSNSVRRWPQGNLYYVYGSYFTQWIAATYGEDALRRMADDYGKQVIPWGFNRAIRRATGKTYIEMYPEWLQSLRERYEAQVEPVKRQGLREGTRLTHHGQIARYPRWIPQNTWPEHAGGLLYYRDDAHDRAGLYALDVQRDAQGAVRKVAETEKKAEHLVRTSGETAASFGPDGSLFFGSQEVTRTVLLFDDLERVDAGQKSTFGTSDGGRTRLTFGLRATDPTISPDGRRIVYVMNRAGTRTIHIADLTSTGVENARPLVATGTFEQAYTPRWSPDGTHVAYSVWKTGGNRDIRYVDVDGGTYRDLMVDRAVDGDPSFSADGRFLFFHSDRTGISNVFAFELETGRLRQVTNVLTGAYMPEPSPDGKTLAYVGYTTAGFDLFAMPLDERLWTDAPEPLDDRPAPPQILNAKTWAVQPYSPWRTLIPRKWSAQITDGGFGRVAIITAAQSDITGNHSVVLQSVTEFEKPELEGNVAYTYGRLPFDMGISAFRSLSPRGGYGLGQYKPVVVQESTGLSTSIGYNDPTPYDNRSYVIAYTVSRIGAELPIPTDKLDPYETPSFPVRGLTASLRLQFAYSNAERYLWSVGAERGYSFNLTFDWTDPKLGSDYQGFVTNGDFTSYYRMPWLKHHSVALHGGLGTSGGAFPGRGAFYVGSFVDLPLVDVVQNQLYQGGITLRGYPSVIEAGRSYALGNVEYRFPIVNVDRGPSTLPFFVNRISGNVFFDYGSAFDALPDARFKSGTGAELWFDLTLGYVQPFTFRLGYARGLASGGIDKPYFVAAIPY
ncbi:MAG: tolB protein precursor [Labilithrix sp.]|nr:tolB protein precursor [Labilithrix sp.]